MNPAPMKKSRKSQKKRIGVLGGTFDPIHMGHLVLAEQVKERLKLDGIIFIPCFRSPHKTRQKLSPAKDRLHMIRLALQGNPSFSVSEIELKRKGVSYTIDTLRELRKLHPGSETYFLTGSDVVNELNTWKDPEEIFRLVRMVIAIRPGFDQINRENRFVKKSIVVKITGLDISSSELRKRVKRGESIKYLVPVKVEQYIRKKRLYRR
jgi:nicotinate-nucleotide adenylyltransferase